MSPLRYIVAQSYIAARRAVRWVLLRQRVLGPDTLNRLASLDEGLRRRGVLKGAASDSFRYDGCTFTFGGDSRGIAESILTIGSYEEPTVREMTAILRPGSVFLDAGANIGFFTVLAARLVGERGRVCAFEPTPSTREVLARNVEINGFSNVAVEGFAIGERRGRGFFRVTAESEANHLVDAEPTAIDVPIEIISIDEYCDAHGIETVDLIKLDIEGQEIAAFNSMRAVCGRSPAIAVVFELNAEAIRRSGQDVDVFFTSLQELGFHRFKVLLDSVVEFRADDDKTFLFDLMQRYNPNILALKQ